MDGLRRKHPTIDLGIVGVRSRPWTLAPAMWTNSGAYEGHGGGSWMRS